MGKRTVQCTAPQVPTAWTIYIYFFFVASQIFQAKIEEAFTCFCLYNMMSFNTSYLWLKMIERGTENVSQNVVLVVGAKQQSRSSALILFNISGRVWRSWFGGNRLMHGYPFHFMRLIVQQPRYWEINARLSTINNGEVTKPATVFFFRFNNQTR